MLLTEDVSDDIGAFSGEEVKDCRIHACAGVLDTCPPDLD